MNRFLSVAVAAIAFVGLGACSSDSKPATGQVTLPADASVPDVTLPSLTLPSDLSLPGNLEDCRSLAVAYAALLSQAFAPTGGEIDVDKIFGDATASVPADLQDDLQVLATVFGEYSKVLQANGNDFTSAEVQAAVQALSTPEVEAASNNLSAYFDTTCPQG
jgi:hypothetical protein